MGEKQQKKIDPSTARFLFEMGQRIRYLRIQKGLTQDELAKRLGYTSRSTINKIEKGLVDMPFTKIQDFAKVFDIRPQFFFFNYGRQRKLPGRPKPNKITIKTVDNTELVFGVDNNVVEQIIALLEEDMENKITQQNEQLELELKQELEQEK